MEVKMENIPKAANDNRSDFQKKIDHYERIINFDGE